ncbi:dihydroorotate dehydrogenase [Lactobacillus gigeriorum]|uniref:Dihydroorotate dehydrogenase n=1 Tax=Lactobacillus gigeriorum DSM 23908 = CRBIP 24.85 TaxID=1423751 RepID=I7K1L1_9LACO|nr:dihydroorotate dehydrogenase [Lactobacillus gigeriorum]KRN10294.1 dihydroorotate dehydrogenase 1B [Lactobacillus gigeriorum DSM 23908 = CRBIP 24.85]CCI87510.1 Dihydroorotate dehydrogenase A (fumarate) [Lactobacillus gigeriorum DSM 23908 = CRBIP 24.85]
MANIKVNLPGLSLKNPVMPASGTFGFGDQKYAFDLEDLGAFVFKTVTPQEGLGNPQPQIFVSQDWIMNSVGLTNPGVEAAIETKMKPLRLQHPNLPMVASIAGGTEQDYVDLAEKIDQAQVVDALEVNLSCPNVAEGGMLFGINSQIVERVIANIKNKVSLPVYAKLTPNVTDIAEIARAAQSGGADGISLINTVYGLEIDIKTRKPVLGNNAGGLSGKSVQPLALRMVHDVYEATKLPIIGMGGIYSAEDVVKFFLAGARAVAVGSAHFEDHQAAVKIVQALPELLAELGVDDINDLVGQVEFN